MSGLCALNLVTSKRQRGNGPHFACRQKLSSKLDEQIQLAIAAQSGEDFSPPQDPHSQRRSNRVESKDRSSQEVEALVVD